MNKVKSSEPLEQCPVKLKSIIETLFPTHVPPNLSHTVNRPGTDPVPITRQEIINLADRLKCGKAPGIDCIPINAIKAAMLAYPDVFKNVLMNTLTTGQLQSMWKRQKFVLIPKPGKPLCHLSALRPLGLVDNLAKV